MICDFNPNILVLQETYFKPQYIVTLMGFDYYFKTNVSDGRAISGRSIFVRQGVPHEPLQLESHLQVVAVKVSLHRTITICCIYIPPHFTVAQKDLDDLVNELPQPFLLLGDFNGHNQLWGDDNCDSLGEKVENVLDCLEVCSMITLPHICIPPLVHKQL